MTDLSTGSATAGSDAVPSPRDKVRSVAELGTIAERERNAGRKVVLAHGVFDLLHMGHVRHLEAARREGDVLMVTVTADRFVNRGPGRPVFSEWQRAEMLAALGFVDWAGINDAPTAEPVITTVQPDIYAKGSDYVDADDDVTGNIGPEHESVRAHGGRIVFTDEITFSSSALINSHLDIYSPELRACLDSYRDEGAGARMLNLIERVRDYRILMIGDAIIDEYRYVRPMGKSPKENMIATRFETEEVFAGGIFAAANHVADFCAEVEVVTCLGGDDSYEDLVRQSLRPNVRLTTLTRPGVPTTRKSRFVDVSYQRKLFEVYFMDDTPLDATLTRELDDIIADRAADADVVEVADFGHGLIGPSTVQTIVDTARFFAVATQSNSANLGYNLVTRYPGADYVCIDEAEARLAVADKFASVEHLVSEALPPRIDCDKFIVTHGNHGCVTYDRAGSCRRIPAFTETVVDTMGAGDAFFSVSAPLVAAGGDMHHVGFIGNAVGALKVGIVGHRRSVEKSALLKYLITLLK